MDFTLTATAAIAEMRKQGIQPKECWDLAQAFLSKAPAGSIDWPRALKAAESYTERRAA
jgi:hypothetical protein